MYSLLVTTDMPALLSLFRFPQLYHLRPFSLLRNLPPCSTISIESLPLSMWASHHIRQLSLPVDHQLTVDDLQIYPPPLSL
jgi:hypothetical protein